MAVIFADGFDLYHNTLSEVTGISRRWTAGATDMSMVAGRFGGRAVQLQGGATNRHITTPTWTGVGSLTLACSFKVNTTSNAPCISFMTGATTHLSFNFPASGTDAAITATRGASGGTSLGTSGAATVPVGEWMTLEIEVVISDTVGRVTVYVNNTQILNLTNQDTANSATLTVNSIKLGPNTSNTNSYVFDDLTVHDSATKPASFYYCETVAPDADGATLDWTPSTGTSHYAVLDEQPSTATDYISASTVGNKDFILTGSMASTPVSILCAQAVGFFAKTDGTGRSAKLDVKSGATTSAGTSTALTTSGTPIHRLFATDPDTGAAWTQSGIEGTTLIPEVTV